MQRRTTIAEEWSLYQEHFRIKADDPGNAFYMGCLRMLQFSQRRSQTQLKRIALELDRYLSRDDSCACDACRRLLAQGLGYSLVNDLFGETAQ